MIRLRRRRAQARPHTAVTPADAADLQAARSALEQAHEAREQVERDLQRTLSRWPVVLATVAHLRRIREENHIADDLHVIFMSDGRQ